MGSTGMSYMMNILKQVANLAIWYPNLKNISELELDTNFQTWDLNVNPNPRRIVSISGYFKITTPCKMDYM